MQSNDITDAGAASIAGAVESRCASLTSLDFAYNELTDYCEAAFGRLLFRHPDLKLGLENTSIPAVSSTSLGLRYVCFVVWS